MKSLKQEWAKIPQNVRDFAPHIQQNLLDFWDKAARCDDENWTQAQLNAEMLAHQQKTQDLLRDFKAAGGSETHWNIISQAVINGKMHKLQP